MVFGGRRTAGRLRRGNIEYDSFICVLIFTFPKLNLEHKSNLLSFFDFAKLTSPNILDQFLFDFYIIKWIFYTYNLIK